MPSHRSNNPMGIYVETDQGDSVSWDNVDKETFAKAYREFRRILGVPENINGRTPLPFQPGQWVMCFHPERFGEKGVVCRTYATDVTVEFDDGGRLSGITRDQVELLK